MTLRHWARLLFVSTILVILWGAWVRISHSGDGCGDTWPLCQGRLVPEAQAGKTWVEYGHRAMSGLYGIAVVALWIYVRQRFPAGHALRRAANFVLLFMITEALLGAKLVLFGLVTANASWWRTVVMSLHQVNSLLLSGSVATLALLAGDEHLRPRPRAVALQLLFVVIAVTGAWAALASTLFAGESLWEGLMKDFSPDSHHLLRLRILHPLTALLGGGGLAVFMWVSSLEETSPRRTIHRQTAILLACGLLFGISTLLSLSPTWMKITHLALAHLMWAGLLRWSLLTSPRLNF